MWRAGAQVSREPPPPLPGGYVVGDKVYYFESVDQLEHSEQGEVVGPATSQRLRGKGVAVRFPNIKGAINITMTIDCCLTQARLKSSPCTVLYAQTTNTCIWNVHMHVHSCTCAYTYEHAGEP